MSETRKRPLSDLTDLLAPALGQDAAVKAIRDHASQLQLPPVVGLEQALALMESMSSSSNVLGAVALFAKSRLRLKWDHDSF